MQENLRPQECDTVMCIKLPIIVEGKPAKKVDPKARIPTESYHHGLTWSGDPTKEAKKVPKAFKLWTVPVPGVKGGKGKKK